MDDDIDEIARAWATAKAAQQRAAAAMKARAPALLAYFERHPEARDVAGVVGLSTHSRVYLDRSALRARLGGEVALFERRRAYRTLTLLAEPAALPAAAPRPGLHRSAHVLRRSLAYRRRA